MLDAFTLLADTIERYKLYRIIKSSPKISCETGSPWLDGPYLMKHLKMNNFKGLSGNFDFDVKTGYRKNVTIGIVDKTKSGVDLFGYWRDNNERSIYIVRSYSKEKSQVEDKLNRSLVVTIKMVCIMFYLFTVDILLCFRDRDARHRRRGIRFRVLTLPDPSKFQQLPLPSINRTLTIHPSSIHRPSPSINRPSPF